MPKYKYYIKLCLLQISQNLSVCKNNKYVHTNSSLIFKSYTIIEQYKEFIKFNAVVGVQKSIKMKLLSFGII